MTGRPTPVVQENVECTLLAEAFAAGGYQSYAVGKLHLRPQRSRLGFDDVQLYEDGKDVDRTTEWTRSRMGCG